MTDEGISLESPMVDEGWVMESAWTDKGMSIESEMVDEGFVI